ncbi:MAG: hypothetical protein D3905_05405, partial [Candidatus Electrothrix sp. AS4_5]|nr:hypothetical protein [Candidatus Electrothrix gigas]
LAAQKHLQAQFSPDEEIVCVTENDSCSVDAIQVLTGCSIGKGNPVTYSQTRTGMAMKFNASFPVFLLFRHESYFSFDIDQTAVHCSKCIFCLKFVVRQATRERMPEQ